MNTAMPWGGFTRAKRRGRKRYQRDQPLTTSNRSFEMATLNPTPADSMDVLDALTTKCAHLESLLCMTYGEAAQAFNSMNDEIRDNYLWHAAEMASEIKELASSLRPATVQVQA